LDTYLHVRHPVFTFALVLLETFVTVKAALHWLISAD
jgi:hypothetical protein